MLHLPPVHPARLPAHPAARHLAPHPAQHPAQWRIGRFVLHATLDELEFDGQRTKLEPRLTQVLLALCAHPGEVVSAQALRDEVWGRVRVTPSSVYEAIARLRQVLAADAATAAYITNVPRRGYRLVAPVTPPAPDKSAGPRIVVLPFRATGLDERLASLRERLLEGLIAAMSRHTACTVMARGSVLALATDADVPGQAARLFGARFVVDGSIVNRGGSGGTGTGLVIRAELIDTQSRELLWTEAVETPPQDGPELAGPLVERLARALEMQLMAALAREGTGPLAEARRLAMASWVELFCRPQNEGTNRRAWAMSQQSLGQEHEEALGLTTRAYASWRAATYGWQGLQRDATYAAGLADVERVIAQQPQMHDAHFTLSLLAAAHGELARAEEASRQCLHLVPDSAPAWGLLGAWRAFRGHPEETEALCLRALDLSPCEPLRATWYWHMSRAALEMGDPARGLEAAQQGLAANPELPGVYLCGAAAAQQCGRTDLAQRYVAWLAARPRYATAKQVRANHSTHNPVQVRFVELLCASLRAAGLPEG